jgi:hypothetical protein
MSHPKVLGLPAGAIACWLEGLCYAGQHLTDGAIPSQAVEVFRFRAGARALVAAGLWHPLETGGYRIHDYVDYNPSRRTVLDRREADALRKGGRPVDVSVPPADAPPTDLDARAVYDLYRAAAEEVAHKLLPLDPLPRDWGALAILARSYTRAQFDAAVRAWWRDRRIKYRYLSVLVQDIGRFIVSTEAASETDWRDECVHAPPCGTPERHRLLLAREATR